MKRLLPLTSVTTTSVAFAALCAGAGVANADGFSQTNLVLDRPDLATTDSSLVNPWGVSFANGESHLDFEPGHKYVHALSGDRQHGRRPDSLHGQHSDGDNWAARPDRAGRQHKYRRL